uniref:Protein arginine N-methyltransferase n=1 Tax=Rhizophora mucronata TaxID=61149 RepID=A0A2P2MP13_RHIMU
MVVHTGLVFRLLSEIWVIWVSHLGIQRTVKSQIRDLLFARSFKRKWSIHC